MKILALILVGVLIALQYPLWFGKGGWLRVRDLQQQVDAQKAVTTKMEARNRAFDAEVRDLKSGYDALEADYRRVIRQPLEFPAIARQGKRLVLETGLSAGVRRLADRLLKLMGRGPTPAAV